MTKLLPAFNSKIPLDALLARIFVEEVEIENSSGYTTDTDSFRNRSRFVRLFEFYEDKVTMLGVALIRTSLMEFM